MTQDFARRRREQARTKPRYKSNIPAWVWLFTGSVLGAFVMFLIYLAGIAPQSDEDNSGLFSLSKIFSGDKPATTNEPPLVVTSKPVTKPATEDKKEGDGIKFEFWDRLKSSEVEATEKPLNREEVARQKNYSCLLQVASFRSQEDADRARAQLTLLNLEPWIEKGTTRDQRPIYRIKIGPFNSKPRLDAVRPTLWDNGYDDHLVLCPQN